MLSIDIIILSFYLLLTLVVGYKYEKGIKTIKDYALVGKNFNTATLAATLIATAISGSWFIVSMQNSYNDGIIYFIANTGNIINALIVAYNHNIIVDYKESIPHMIEFDQLKMYQLFSHIIKNSIKFSNGGEKNQILIKIRKDTPIFLNKRNWERLRITVEDKEIAIPEDELESVFEPFKISSRTKSDSSGKGMGLAIVKEIVAGHLGNVRATNNIQMYSMSDSVLQTGITIHIQLPILHPKDSFLAKNVASHKEKPGEENNIPIIIQSVLTSENELIQKAMSLGAHSIITKPYRKYELSMIVKNTLGIDE